MSFYIGLLIFAAVMIAFRGIFISDAEVGILDSMNPDAQKTGLGTQLRLAQSARFGEKWFVDLNVTASGDGKSQANAFKTLTEAVAAASAYDTIYVGSGYYTEAAVIDIDVTGLRIIGTGNGRQWGPCGLGSATSLDHIFTINADRVEIAGLAFWCLTDTKDGIQIATTYDAWNTWIHDCAFGTGSADADLGEYGIKLNAAEDAANTLIERCSFHYMSTAAIVVNATRASIENNLIWVPADKIGIDVETTGLTRPNTYVADNRIIGRGGDASGVGIKLADTEPTDGAVFVVGNDVTNITTPITKGKGDAGLVNNGTYGDGDEWTKIDPT